MANRERFLNALTAIAAACTMVVTGVLVVDHLQPKQASVPQADRANREVTNWAELTSGGRHLGPSEAPITVVYFGDFECPACGGFSRMLEGFRSAHPADIRVVFRHWPLPYHRFAYPSARAAECAAAQGRFEQMFQVLYAVQDSLGLVPFGELAVRAGVADARAFESCARKATPVQSIETDRKMAVDLRLRGTPGVIINGTMINERIPTAEDLQALISKMRARGS